MKDNDSATGISPIALGLAFTGVLVFSLTFPATAFALEGLGPALIGTGRNAVAALPAALLLLAAAGPLPRRAEWAGLAVVAVGVVFGFPLLTALALDHGSSSAHAAIVIGVLPAATAVCGVLRAGERPSRTFWLASGAGAVCVTGFAVIRGAGAPTAADLLLLAALLAAAVGYTEGGRLARTMGGWRVTCWSAVLSVPVTLPLTLWLLASGDAVWTARSIGGFAYLAFGSSFLGFFAWYAGLARAGIARGGQIQLVQPLLTLVWAALLLGEHIDALTLAAALAVLLCVAFTQRARVGSAPRPLASRDAVPHDVEKSVTTR
ncbi:DMT family transporter [Actinomadura flavalba]|uniref:DMT family transporter n=1 Tax=Actinomadura flavalba TaxID=1120938 RepID=UPI0009DC4A95|nr:DMT family transporter [Actinomadura flavalba]